MSKEEQLETLITQVVHSMMTMIPTYVEEMEDKNEIFKIRDLKEFTYGVVLGMILGTSSGTMNSLKGDMLTPKDLIAVKEAVYRHIPEIREQIFD